MELRKDDSSKDKIIVIREVNGNLQLETIGYERKTDVIGVLYMSLKRFEQQMLTSANELQ